MVNSITIQCNTVREEFRKPINGLSGEFTGSNGYVTSRTASLSINGIKGRQLFTHARYFGGSELDWIFREDRGHLLLNTNPRDVTHINYDSGLGRVPPEYWSLDWTSFDNSLIEIRNHFYDNNIHITLHTIPFNIIKQDALVFDGNISNGTKQLTASGTEFLQYMRPLVCFYFEDDPQNYTFLIDPQHVSNTNTTLNMFDSAAVYPGTTKVNQTCYLFRSSAYGGIIGGIQTQSGTTRSILSDNALEDWADFLVKQLEHCEEEFGIDFVNSVKWSLWNEQSLYTIFFEEHSTDSGHFNYEEYTRIYEYVRTKLKTSYPNMNLAWGPHSGMGTPLQDQQSWMSSDNSDFFTVHMYGINSRNTNFHTSDFSALDDNWSYSDTADGLSRVFPSFIDKEKYIDECGPESASNDTNWKKTISAAWFIRMMGHMQEMEDSSELSNNRPARKIDGVFLWGGESHVGSIFRQYGPFVGGATWWSQNIDSTSQYIYGSPLTAITAIVNHCISGNSISIDWTRDNVANHDENIHGFAVLDSNNERLWIVVAHFTNPSVGITPDTYSISLTVNNLPFAVNEVRRWHVPSIYDDWYAGFGTGDNAVPARQGDPNGPNTADLTVGQCDSLRYRSFFYVTNEGSSIPSSMNLNSDDFIIYEVLGSNASRSWHVDLINGNDWISGSEDLPFKTLERINGTDGSGRSSLCASGDNVIIHGSELNSTISFSVANVSVSGNGVPV